MNFEIILWIVAWIVISEIIFIVWVKKDKDVYPNWVLKKIYSLLEAFLFIFLQLIIGCSFNDGNSTVLFNNINYINYFYEFLILLGISIFFGINYLIQKKINGK